MSQETDMMKFKWVIFIFVLFVFSMYKSCQEIQYLTSGKKATTKVSRVTEAKNHRGRMTGYEVRYQYRNENSQLVLEGSTHIGINEDTDYPIGKEIEVEYIGKNQIDSDSRIAGTGQYTWLILLTLFFAALVGAGIYIFKTPINKMH